MGEDVDGIGIEIDDTGSSGGEGDNLLTSPKVIGTGIGALATGIAGGIYEYLNPGGLQEGFQETSEHLKHIPQPIINTVKLVVTRVIPPLAGGYLGSIVGARREKKKMAQDAENLKSKELKDTVDIGITMFVDAKDGEGGMRNEMKIRTMKSGKLTEIFPGGDGRVIANAISVAAEKASHDSIVLDLDRHIDFMANASVRNWYSEQCVDYMKIEAETRKGAIYDYEKYYGAWTFEPQFTDKAGEKDEKSVKKIRYINFHESEVVKTIAFCNAKDIEEGRETGTTLNDICTEEGRKNAYTDQLMEYITDFVPRAMDRKRFVALAQITKEKLRLEKEGKDLPFIEVPVKVRGTDQEEAIKKVGDMVLAQISDTEKAATTSPEDLVERGGNFFPSEPTKNNDHLSFEPRETTEESPLLYKGFNGTVSGIFTGNEDPSLGATGNDTILLGKKNGKFAIPGGFIASPEETAESAFFRESGEEAIDLETSGITQEALMANHKVIYEGPIVSDRNGTDSNIHDRVTHCRLPQGGGLTLRKKGENPDKTEQFEDVQFYSIPELISSGAMSNFYESQGAVVKAFVISQINESLKGGNASIFQNLPDMDLGQMKGRLELE